MKLPAETFHTFLYNHQLRAFLGNGTVHSLYLSRVDRDGDTVLLTQSACLQSRGSFTYFPDQSLVRPGMLQGGNPFFWPTQLMMQIWALEATYQYDRRSAGATRRKAATKTSSQQLPQPAAPVYTRETSQPVDIPISAGSYYGRSNAQSTAPVHKRNVHQVPRSAITASIPVRASSIRSVTRMKLIKSAEAYSHKLAGDNSTCKTCKRCTLGCATAVGFYGLQPCCHWSTSHRAKQSQFNPATIEAEPQLDKRLHFYHATRAIT